MHASFVRMSQLKELRKQQSRSQNFKTSTAVVGSTARFYSRKQSPTKSSLLPWVCQWLLDNKKILLNALQIIICSMLYNFPVFKPASEINFLPKSSNSRSSRASWSLNPCSRPLVANAIDGGMWTRNSVWPSKPLAAAAWARAWAWSCWQVAYIRRLVASKKTPTTSHSYIHRATSSVDTQ